MLVCLSVFLGVWWYYLEEIPMILQGMQTKQCSTSVQPLGLLVLHVSGASKLILESPILTPKEKGEI